MIHEDDDDDEDDDSDGGFYHDDFNRPPRDPFDDAFRFGFSFGPGGTRFEEPQLFGKIFRDMEEIFAGLGRFDERHGFGHRGAPSIEALPPQEGIEKGRGRGGSSNPIRDFMLKSPDSSPYTPALPPPLWDTKGQGFLFSTRSQQLLSSVETLFKESFHAGISPDCLHFIFSFMIFGKMAYYDQRRERKKRMEILTPVPSQPKIRSTFKSVSVTKVVRPDGTVEERRTVRDGEGNEETTVTISGPGGRDGPQDQSGPLMPG
ncbi:HCLS1-associated protein X-1 [Labeo rohita]|uniref:HCLS1-associated protein X-1 n=1 Tax=Labeo rohita TaxID=84645 RepID=A0ABQ8LQZ2_LABRO|nr:HCLS1-associated protein X-1 [Labeo rohita]